ncbi:hypothetical protein A3Q56_02233 [Intoshia linei]|uniref:Uncharacterized protein n=1 Tax=Intoshia linei TaxID=1819745 RepID=A0A177B704_9BILA|nr:hypothetical protein A3Q56_02233 [Intoshia linei]
MDGNNAQLNQYEKSLADLVAAYKLLQKQNETLQSTLNVIIDKPTTSSGSQVFQVDPFILNLQEKQSNSDIKSKYELLKLNLAKTSSQLANMQSCYGVERKAILYTPSHQFCNY